MKWNVFLVAVSVGLLSFFWSADEFGWVAAGSNGADSMASQIGVEADIIRPILTEWLRKDSELRTRGNNFALAILSLLLTVRLVADVVRERKVPPTGSASR